jgi:hypothetical protein
MNRDDIIRMAQEAGMVVVDDQFSLLPFLERFFHMAQAAEREACAKVVDENAAGCLGLLKHVLKANANAIRLRGNDD